MNETIKATKLSPAQYKLMEEIRRNGKVATTLGNRRTYKKLIEWGLVDYTDSYNHIRFTEKGKQVEL